MADEEKKTIQLCPECGIDLSTKNRKTHAYMHWNRTEKDYNDLPTEAQKRFRQVVGF